MNSRWGISANKGLIDALPVGNAHPTIPGKFFLFSEMIATSFASYHSPVDAEQLGFTDSIKNNFKEYKP